jgi:hypothetical protein
MSGLFLLTPSLSLRERGNQGQSLGTSWRASFTAALAAILPLPKGEGWGEGEETVRPRSGVAFAIALTTSDFGLRTSDFGLQRLRLS